MIKKLEKLPVFNGNVLQCNKKVEKFKVGNIGAVHTWGLDTKTWTGSMISNLIYW